MVKSTLVNRIESFVNEWKNITLKPGIGWRYTMGRTLQQHPEVTVGMQPMFEAKVISTSKTEIARKFREAIEIRDRKPPIDKSKGWVITWFTYSCFWHCVHQVNVARYGDIVGSKKFFFWHKFGARRTTSSYLKLMWSGFFCQSSNWRRANWPERSLKISRPWSEVACIFGKRAHHS